MCISLIVIGFFLIFSLGDNYCFIVKEGELPLGVGFEILFHSVHALAFFWTKSLADLIKFN